MDFSIKKKQTVYSLFVILLFLSNYLFAQQIRVFGNIPGRSSSDHYLVRVKFVSEDDTSWRTAFVLQTRGKKKDEDLELAYYDVIREFTASWIAFESDFNGDNVVVEISKKDGSPITKAMVRPVGEAQPATISNGKAYVIFSEPANVNVDINGQMEDNYTGFGYTGPKVHTITLFANPIFEVPTGTDVKVLQPNEDIRTVNRTTYPKIVFAPGVHNIGLALPILSNQVLYIPGDAVLHGTIHPLNAWNNNASKNFKVIGSGTLSGENIVRNPNDDLNIATKPFTYQAEGAHLEGFVVADPAFHTFNMGHSGGNLNNINIYKNLKILAWRINSDGINAFRSSEVSDCFFRVQDDAFYYGSSNVNQHDNTVWMDANGAVIFLQNILDGSSSTFRDVKVIYHRANWHWWDGGRIVSMRQFRDNKTISNVLVKNILVEDPLPAFPPFYGSMDVNATGTNMVFNNIVIENVRQDHDGVSTSLDANRGKPQNTLKGLPNQLWENITFKNCSFKGVNLTSFQDVNFNTDYVDANTVVFTTSQRPLKIFDGETNLNWNTAKNWKDDLLPNEFYDVIIPSGFNVAIDENTTAQVNDLIINNSSTVSIADGGILKVNGIAPSNKITSNKLLQNTNWHLVGAPLTGITFNDTFVNQNNIASGNGNNKGIASYITSSNTWSYLQSLGSLPSVPGNGYAIKKQDAGNIRFTGSINVSDISVAVSNLGSGLNLLSNPFTSYLNSSSFLSNNSSNLNSQTIWIWNPVTSQYETKVTINNYVIEPGQGFFIKSKNGINLNILANDQTLTNSTQKSEKSEVKLLITDGIEHRFAQVYYLANATKGFDNGYDGATFDGITQTFDVYTELLENGKGQKHQIQSLPNSDFENMVIPIGVSAEAGKKISFSCETQNLPSGVKVYLEDREQSTITPLDASNNNYKIQLSKNENGFGRFFMHTKSTGLTLDTFTLNDVYFYINEFKTLKISGITDEKATIVIYNILGKKIIEKKTTSKGVIEIDVSIIKSGIYLLQIETNKGKISKKMMLN